MSPRLLTSHFPDSHRIDRPIAPRFRRGGGLGSRPRLELGLPGPCPMATLGKKSAKCEAQQPGGQCPNGTIPTGQGRGGGVGEWGAFRGFRNKPWRKGRCHFWLFSLLEEMLTASRFVADQGLDFHREVRYRARAPGNKRGPCKWGNQAAKGGRVGLWILRRGLLYVETQGIGGALTPCFSSKGDRRDLGKPPERGERGGGSGGQAGICEQTTPPGSSSKHVFEHHGVQVFRDLTWFKRTLEPFIFGRELNISPLRDRTLVSQK